MAVPVADTAGAQPDREAESLDQRCFGGLPAYLLLLPWSALLALSGLPLATILTSARLKKAAKWVTRSAAGGGGSALHVMLGCRCCAMVDQKRVPIQRRSITRHGHPSRLSTMPVPQV
jgi:hypothetical protein